MQANSLLELNRTCKICKRIKPLTTEYWGQCRSKTTHTIYFVGKCKQCYKLINQRYREENRAAIRLNQRNLKDRNKDLYRQTQLIRDFGITIERYNELLIEQHNKCAVCLKEESSTYRGNVKHLAVDHNHITGQIRGLVCVKCNTALGSFHGDTGTDILKRAIKYLEEYEQRVL